MTLRYADAEGVLLLDRERWTVRVGKGLALEAERTFVGTVLDDGTLVPSSSKPETLKGAVAPDGTLALKGEWADPEAARTFRRLLAAPAGPAVRRFVWRDPAVRLPGSGLDATLSVEAILVSARLGGKMVPLGAAGQKG